MKRRCICHICRRHRTLRKICQNLSQADSIALMGIIEELEGAEEQGEYYQAILRNEWPGRHVIIVEEPR